MFSSLLSLLWMETENASAASSAMRKLAVSLADSLGRVLEYPSLKFYCIYKYILKFNQIKNKTSAKKFYLFWLEEKLKYLTSDRTEVATGCSVHHDGGSEDG